MVEFADSSFMNEKTNDCDKNQKHNWRYETPSYRFCTECAKIEMYDGRKWQVVLNEG